MQQRRSHKQNNHAHVMQGRANMRSRNVLLERQRQLENKTREVAAPARANPVCSLAVQPRQDGQRQDGQRQDGQPSVRTRTLAGSLNSNGTFGKINIRTTAADSSKASKIPGMSHACIHTYTCTRVRH